MKKMLAFLKFTLPFFMLLFFLLNSKQTVYHCKKAVDMCLYTALPSLFVFCVFSELTAARIKCLSPNNAVLTIVEKVFSLNSASLIICLFSFFSGAPAACCGLLYLYAEGKASKTNVENALLLFPGCSASFILTIAAASVGSTKIAILLLICEILAILSSYFILCRKSKPFTENGVKKITVSSDFTDEITSSIKNAVKNMALMCGFIVFFRVVAGVIADAFYKVGISGPVFTSLLFGFFEVTGGVVQCVSISGNAKIFTTAAIISFSGISVIFQIAFLCKKYAVNIKPFIYSRILTAILCPIYMIVFMLFLPYDIMCFSDVFAASAKNAFICGVDILTTAFVPCITVFTAVVFLSLDKKYRKKQRKM